MPCQLRHTRVCSTFVVSFPCPWLCQKKGETTLHSFPHTPQRACLFLCPFSFRASPSQTLPIFPSLAAFDECWLPTWWSQVHHCPWHPEEVPAAWWINRDLHQHMPYSRLEGEPEKTSKGCASQTDSSLCECVWGIITSHNNLKQRIVSMGKSSF